VRAIAVTGEPARALEQVVARLSLEPGVRDLHWHLDDMTLDADKETAAT
jgi:putative Mg2+ transporter-C (MgtC) family protein